MPNHFCPTDEPGAASRRQFLGAVALGVGFATEARAASVPAPEADVTFMREAIAQARQADFPFGAVIVADSEIRARGLNLG